MIIRYQTDDALEHVAAAWRMRSGVLASWTMDHLANRLDAWGGYNASGPVTRRGQLTHLLLTRHFQGRAREHIVGLHAAGPDNMTRWGALDIDHHVEADDEDWRAAETNRLTALEWYRQLVRMGFHPLLTGSDGSGGGFHLRILLAKLIAADRVHAFLKHGKSDYKQLGLDHPPEQFPKQFDVRKCEKGMGNWLRLPGRHHKRDYWSEAWNGSRWLVGHDAIDYMVSLTGDDPALVPNVPAPTAPPRLRGQLPNVRDARMADIVKYMERLPHLSAGQGRDDVAFNFAAFLARDLALDDATALLWLEMWDKDNNPPKGRERLAQIVKNVRVYGQRAEGCGLQRRA